MSTTVVTSNKSKATALAQVQALIACTQKELPSGSFTLAISRPEVWLWGRCAPIGERNLAMAGAAIEMGGRVPASAKLAHAMTRVAIAHARADQDSGP
jgi:hypothetical protein